MSKTTPEDYAQSGGISCPACDSRNVDSHSSVQIAEGCAWQDMECGKCGATWTDQYDLIGYDNLDLELDNVKN